MRCFLIVFLLCIAGACDELEERILARFMCDGIKDCSDQSDEDSTLCRRPAKSAFSTRFRYGIKGRRCPSAWFFCADGSNCITSRYVCDDHKDCRDGSDEAEFCHGLNEKKRKASDKIVY